MSNTINLSQTRWSCGCHSDSCQALTHNYIKIIKALKYISENRDSKRDAKMLLKQIKKKEFAYLPIFFVEL